MLILKTILLIFYYWFAPEFFYTIDGEKSLAVDNEQKLCKVFVVDERFEINDNWEFLKESPEADKFKEACDAFGYSFDNAVSRGTLTSKTKVMVAFVYALMALFFAFFISSVVLYYKNGGITKLWIAFYLGFVGAVFILTVLKNITFDLVL